MLSRNDKSIIGPNAGMSNNPIINYSVEGTLRVDLIFGIAKDADISKAKEILKNIIEEDSRLQKDPVPLIAVSELADNSVNRVARPGCKSADD